MIPVFGSSEFGIRIPTVNRSLTLMLFQLFQVFLETVRHYRLTTEQASTLKSVAKAFAYAEEFSCWPPTLFMITVTFIETAFFIYHVIHLPGMVQLNIFHL